MRLIGLGGRVRRRTATAGVLGVIALVAVALPTAAGAESLAGVLQAHGVEAVPKALPNRDQPITGYAVRDEGPTLLIAYYLDRGSGGLAAPLFLSRLDRPSARWTHGAIGKGRGPGPPGDLAGCLGSVMDVRRAERRVYLETHLTPSASCTLILSEDFAVREVLLGWPLAILRDGRVVYHRSLVHFAPTHAAEIAIYSPAQARSVTIYPMRPYQAVRLEHIRKVRAVYTQAWCAGRNHHCDPERFDNHLAGPVEVDEQADALAFVVAFDNTVYWPEAERARLEAFRETRRRLPGGALAAGRPDGLLAGLAEDLPRIRRLDLADRTLELFTDDAELRELLEGALGAAALEPGPSPPASFEALDPRWGDAGVRARLARAVETQPEFTEVAHIYRYRHLAGRKRLEYREIPLADLRARFGDRPLRACLAPAVLARIFEDRPARAR